MRAEEAEILLEKNKIDPLIYSIGKPMKVECFTIEEENGVWMTYHWERGARHSLQNYATESAAVAAFLDKVVRIASLSERRQIVLG